MDRHPASAAREESLSTRLIFILGNHRSGTTWLHQMLADSGGVGFLTAYDVIADSYPRGAAPSLPALATRFEELGFSDRGFDGVRLTPDVPEEYNFVLSNARTGGRLMRRNLALFLDLSERLLASHDERPLVLKNPWDYSNFIAIHQALTGARFIFIHRHPERVVQSLLQVSRAVVASKHAYFALLSREYDRLFSRPWRLMVFRALLSRRFDLGARLAVRLVADANRYYVRNIECLPARQLLEIRYEDLCIDTATEVTRALDFCGVARADRREIRTPPRPRHAEITREVQRRRTSIARSMAAYMQRFGYGPSGMVDVARSPHASSKRVDGVVE